MMGKEREYLFADMYNIGSRVREIDPAISISFNKDGGGKYIVSRGQRYIMSVPVGELDERVLLKLRKNDLHRRRLQDFIYELEQSEDEYERRKARELSNHLEAVSLDNFDRIAGIPHYSMGGIS